jgi:hypothetical protein
MDTRAKLLFAAAVAAASSSLGAQTEPESASIDSREQLLEQIAQLRREGGPNPEGVIDPLRALALLYEENEDHVLAIATLEEARYVTRVHEGLSSADEALLLRQQIRSEKALGQHDRVWELEQDMVTIARQHHDDIRMVPVFRELADDRADALEEYRSGGFPPEIELGCYYVPWDPRPYQDQRGKVRPPPQMEGISCRSGQSTAVVGRFRQEILAYYADAIEVILQNEDYASQELRDLEKQALRAGNLRGFNRSCREESLAQLVTLPLLGTCLEPVIRSFGVPIGTNAGGWVSLIRLIAYEIRSGAPAAARANAVAELADWQLATAPPDRRRFGGGDTALRMYELAYREVAPDDTARASIFSPEVPVTLPSYEPNPFIAAATANSPRYIDVSFDVTQYGDAERIEILDTSTSATRAEQRDLIRFIENTTFRPRFVDGKLADAAPVVVRYRLSP